MAERIPPLSVFDSRQSYWSKRKQYWYELLGGTNGMQCGRDCDLLDYARAYKYQNRYAGRKENLLDVGGTVASINDGTSIFDPVLCETIYNWFVPDKFRTVLDPFAGGAVRGVVASKNQCDYIGFDVRKEQIEANEKVSKELSLNPIPKYVHDTSINIPQHIKGNKIDLIFTCPPYYDLEHYSDNSQDISNNATYEEFLKNYAQILKHCYNVLNDNRFFVIVVSDIRDDKGFYRGFPMHTLSILQSFGLKLYNEFILINPYGTAHIRAAGYFNNRKVVRVHQSIYCFYKGDPDRIQLYFTKENGSQEKGIQLFEE